MNLNFRAFAEADQSINSNKNAIYEVVHDLPTLASPYETIKEVKEYGGRKDTTADIYQSPSNEEETYNTLTLT